MLKHAVLMVYNMCNPLAYGWACRLEVCEVVVQDSGLITCRM
jgi:hypothetical protein